MALDISAITGYVEEHKNDLIAKMVGGDTSIRNLTLQTGVKTSTAINIMDVDAVFQNGATAGWTPTGTTTLSQRNIVPGDIKVQEAINPKDINKIYLSQVVRAGSYEDSIPFEQYYAEKKVETIVSANEVATWQGDTASGTNNLSYYDGFIKIIDAASGSTVAGNTGSLTALTAANVVAAIDAMYAALPSDALEATDLVLAVGYDVARLYLGALKDANLFHYKPQDGQFEFEIPGTNVKLFATRGLNGTNRMYMGEASNFVIGVDLENDEENFKIFYSEDDFVVKFHANFKRGVQIAFPDRIVQFKLA